MPWKVQFIIFFGILPFICARVRKCDWHNPLFSFISKKYTSSSGDAKQQGGRHSNRYLTRKVKVITEGGDIPRNMRTPPAQSWFNTYQALALLWVSRRYLSLNAQIFEVFFGPICSVSWQKRDEKTRVGSIYISKKNTMITKIYWRGSSCLSWYLQLKKAGWIGNEKYVSHFSVDVSWTD